MFDPQSVWGPSVVRGPLQQYIPSFMYHEKPEGVFLVKLKGSLYMVASGETYGRYWAKVDISQGERPTGVKPGWAGHGESKAESFEVGDKVVITADAKSMHKKYKGKKGKIKRVDGGEYILGLRGGAEVGVRAHEIKKIEEAKDPGAGGSLLEVTKDLLKINTQHLIEDGTYRSDPEKGVEGRSMTRDQLVTAMTKSLDQHPGSKHATDVSDYSFIDVARAAGITDRDALGKELMKSAQLKRAKKAYEKESGERMDDDEWLMQWDFFAKSTDPL